MSSAIEKLGEDDDGRPKQLTRPSRKRAAKRVSTGNKYNALDVEEASDAEDSDFTDELPALQTGSDSESDSDADKQMTNEEVFQMYIQAPSLLMLYCFQLAGTLPRKTVAERGPAAHSLRAKKNSGHKRGGPSAVPSVQSKRAREEETDDDDAEASAPQLTHSSTVPARSVSLFFSFFCRNVLTLCT